MKSILTVFAFLVFALSLIPSAQAQQTSIANIAPPGSGQGSVYITYGDIVPSTRGGTPGMGGGTTFGLLAGWGGTCTAGQYVSSISQQGVPTCGTPYISNSTTFTVASGCGSVGSVTGGGTTGSFTAGQSSCIPVINLPTATNGWFCEAHDITHPSDAFLQTAKTTTSCTLSATVTSGDLIVFNAVGY